MEPINWSGLVAALIVLITALSTAVSLWNARQTAAIKAEQERVAANLAQVDADGKELRAFLQRNAQPPVIINRTP